MLASMMSTICQAFSFFDSSSLRGRTYDGAVVKSSGPDGDGAGVSGMGGALTSGRPVTDITGGGVTGGKPETEAINLD